ncbi:hypothetical protein OZX56_05475 [Lactobacillus sp. ESL0684]|uniref:hypothetical protein n=1 Tax=unclassified Lactobacillus TaxID=2620435 RepID=UPI0023F940C7|nr:MULTISPECIES: hypothetical protein [unclassified Lactobacillus]WEV40318.1 hypothetical protein OZX59_09140 [Lactobacillus sp. ESL0681]WEV42999.1 hypothetical protein OZX56_05475 [Lactobacillus sp. ESL0684]
MAKDRDLLKQAIKLTCSQIEANSRTTNDVVYKKDMINLVKMYYDELVNLESS